MSRTKAKIKTIEFETEFRICPNCGYEDGFHNMFRKSPEHGRLRWYFVCPQCSATFDIDLKVQAG